MPFAAGLGMIVSALEMYHSAAPEGSSTDAETQLHLTESSSLLHCLAMGLFQHEEEKQTSQDGTRTMPDARTIATVAALISSIRKAAATLLPPDSPHRQDLTTLASCPWAPSDAQTYDWVGNLGGSFAEWEHLQGDVLSHAADLHSMGLLGMWCFNPHCANLTGPSELNMGTQACQGGCGVRYCSLDCQAQGWRMGHRESCLGLETSASSMVR